MSVPKSNAFLNGKLIGITPFCRCEGAEMIDQGEYTLKLVPLEGDLLPFSEKIKITKSVLTVVDRTFGKGATSDGGVISLDVLDDKNAVELLVLSFPDGADVSVDSEPRGKTPLLLKNLTSSDHEVKILKDGYREKPIRVKTISGYKLTISAYLGINLDLIVSPVIPSPSPTAAPVVNKVLILETPTGFLNVRETGSLNGVIIEKINPGESFELISEKENWFEIKLIDGKAGWISSQYAQKQNP